VPRYTDTLCIGVEQTISNCYNSVILPTYDLFEQVWWQFISLSNINGIMGMSYWANP
jgi:hypothetical protein